MSPGIIYNCITPKGSLG